MASSDGVSTLRYVWQLLGFHSFPWINAPIPPNYHPSAITIPHRTQNKKCQIEQPTSAGDQRHNFLTNLSHHRVLCGRRLRVPWVRVTVDVIYVGNVQIICWSAGVGVNQVGRCQLFGQFHDTRNVVWRILQAEEQKHPAIKSVHKTIKRCKQLAQSPCHPRSPPLHVP